jgi:EmrB/QacA subfamily drug resistance transporter
MLAVILAAGAVFLDTSIVNLALKKIGQELPSKLFGVLEGQSYVTNAYFLTLSALLILAGALSDYYGRRKMFLYGLIGFGATSLLCGVAPTMDVLILFRILQGAAGAVVVPGSLAIITSNFEGEDRGRAFGIWAGASAFTTILGPFVGGILVNSVSWRAAFLINVPLVAIATWAAVRNIPESRDEEATSDFDWIGAAIVVLAVGGLSFGTIRGQQREWNDAIAFISLGVGAVATALCPIWMSRAKHPLVPIHLFRSRNFSVTNLSTFLIYGALYVHGLFLSIYFVGTLGYNEPAAGIAFVPEGFFLALFSTYFGRLAGRYGPRMFMAAGPALMGLGLLWVGRIDPRSTPWVFGRGNLLPPNSYLTDVLPAFILFGVGLVVMVAPLTTCLMTSVSTRFSGLASAINNAISRVGAPLVGAVIFVVISGTFYTAIEKRVPSPGIVSSPDFRKDVSPLNPPKGSYSPEIVDASRQASGNSFQLAMTVAAGLLFAGALVNLFWIRNPSNASADAKRE